MSDLGVWGLGVAVWDFRGIRETPYMQPFLILPMALIKGTFLRESTSPRVPVNRMPTLKDPLQPHK